MKIWVDDKRPAPDGYIWCHSVYRAIKEIEIRENEIKEFGQSEYISPIELIDIDDEAGDYAVYGGDYIALLDWLEATCRDYPIRIHSTNPENVVNMRRIIQKNGWEEVK